MIESHENINDTQVTSEDKLYAVLSYFFVTVLATLAVKKDSQYCMFHAKNGMALIVIEIAWLVIATVSIILVDLIGYFIVMVGMFAFFFAHLYGIFTAITGEMRPMPLVSTITQRMNLNNFLSGVKSTIETATKATSQLNSGVTQVTQSVIQATTNPQASVPNTTTTSTQPSAPVASTAPQVTQVDAAKHSFGFKKDTQNIVTKAIENIKSDNV